MIEAKNGSLKIGGGLEALIQEAAIILHGVGSVAANNAKHGKEEEVYEQCLKLIIEKTIEYKTFLENNQKNGSLVPQHLRDNFKKEFMNIPREKVWFSYDAPSKATCISNGEFMLDPRFNDEDFEDLDLGGEI